MNETMQESEEVKVRLLKQQIERSLLQVVELMNLAYRGGYQVRFEVAEVPAGLGDGSPGHHVLKRLSLFREY